MEKLIVVKTLHELQELEVYLTPCELIAFDVETTGVEKGSQIIGFSVCGDLERAFYVILAAWNKDKQQLEELPTKAGAKTFLETLRGKQLVMQNGTFDCAMVEDNFGVSLIESLHTDTLILGHLLNENRPNGLKERGVELYGEDAAKEQAAMKASIAKNGGVCTKDCYELYKADADLIAEYGAKDALLTLKLFYNDVPQLYEENLDSFFYQDESMPLLRGPTYDLNTTGLRVDLEKLAKLQQTLEAECLDAMAFITREIKPHVEEKYPGTSKAKTFNINSGEQLSWLLFGKLNNEFGTLTDGGRELCHELGMKLPYSRGEKNAFIAAVEENFGRIYKKAGFDAKRKRPTRPKKVGSPWKYLKSDKNTLQKLAPRYKWLERYLELAKNQKLLKTYVIGIKEKTKYGVIRPSFLQHGTTSGRYSSRHPNFQNLPREDKRVKSCIVARPGMVFVGADYSQLEPRVFASVSQDETLMNCFAKGEDFYSVVGAPIFSKTKCSLYKSDPNSFATLYPTLRDKSKIIALATPYGRTASQQAAAMNISRDESQDLIDRYFSAYPKVELMMLESHEQAKSLGVVYNLYGRPRRIPDAKTIKTIYGSAPHAELPYNVRSLLNLAMNHRVQSTGASIMNRAAIACWNNIKLLAQEDEQWGLVKIVLQVHDELILEGPEALGPDMVIILKDAMENTTTLPGVALVAEPKIANNLADLK